MFYIKRMLRMLCLVLLVVILVGLTLANPAQAAETNDAAVRQTLAALEILPPEGQAAAAFNRAALARMLVQSSTARNSVSSTVTISPYADVSFRHPQAGYIRAAAQAGYLGAYADGNFQPEEAVSATTAVRSLLTLLGYTREQYGADQWQFAVKLGLLDGLSLSGTQNISQNQANRLFYNALKAVASNGKLHIENLGFSITNGVIDLQSVVETTASGPLTIRAAGWYLGAGLKTDTLTVYRNDNLSSLSALQTYDVVYYSTAMNTVWAYSDKVSGVFKSASPSRLSPSSINLSGMEYALSEAAAAKLTTGGIEYGDNLILLLGGSGRVADILRQDEIVFDVTGFATAAEKIVDAGSDGSEYNGYTLTLITVDGSALTYEVRRNYSNMVGKLVKLSYSNGEIGVIARQPSSIGGIFDAANLRMGEYKLAADVRILEVYSSGAYDTVSPSRLDGLRIGQGQVWYYSKNQAGEISAMFISGITGDALKYGIVTDVTEQETSTQTSASGGSSSTPSSGSYSYVIDGKNDSLSISGSLLNAKKGPAALTFKSGKLDSLKMLESLRSVTLYEGGYVLDKANNRYLLSANVSIYQYTNGEYKLLSTKQALALDTTFTAYYDKTEEYGGRIRILIAD